MFVIRIGRPDTQSLTSRTFSKAELNDLLEWMERKPGTPVSHRLENLIQECLLIAS